METVQYQKIGKETGIRVDGCAYSAGFKISDYNKGHYIPESELKEGLYLEILSKTFRHVCQISAKAVNAVSIKTLLRQPIHDGKPIAIGIAPEPPTYETQDRWWES